MEDTKTRKAQAWVACNKLGIIWKSSLCRKFKVRLFVATIESVFLCGIETWTLTKNTKKQTDGAFARPDASYSTKPFEGPHLKKRSVRSPHSKSFLARTGKE